MLLAQLQSRPASVALPHAAVQFSFTPVMLFAIEEHDTEQFGYTGLLKMRAQEQLEGNELLLHVVVTSVPLQKHFMPYGRLEHAHG